MLREVQLISAQLRLLYSSTSLSDDFPVDCEVQRICRSEDEEEGASCFENRPANCLPASTCLGWHFFLSDNSLFGNLRPVSGVCHQLPDRYVHVQGSIEAVQANGWHCVFQRMLDCDIVFSALPHRHNICIVSKMIDLSISYIVQLIDA